MGDFMDDLDEFKRFVQTKPELATLVHQGKYRWQELYEMYSLYGREHEVWQNLTKKDELDLVKLIKNIDIDVLISGMQSIDKILELLVGYLESNQNER